VTAPQTAYDNDPRVAWDGGNGWNVTVPHLDIRDGLPTGHVERWTDGTAESYWVIGNPERQQHASPDEALARFLGAA